MGPVPQLYLVVVSTVDWLWESWLYQISRAIINHQRCHLLPTAFTGNPRWLELKDYWQQTCLFVQCMSS